MDRITARISETGHPFRIKSDENDFDPANDPDF